MYNPPPAPPPAGDRKEKVMRLPAGDRKEGNAKFEIVKILKWNLWHSVGILAAGLIAIYTQNIWLFPLIGITSIAFYVLLFKKELSKYSPPLGWANIITLSRVMLIGVAFLLVDHPILQVVVLVIAIVSDAFDGKVARATNCESDFGLYLDMESDSFFVAAVSLLLWTRGDISDWVLVVGFLRYIYVLITYLFSFQNIKEPKRKYASILAVTYFTCLMCEMAFDILFFNYALTISALTIVASFGLSFYYQLKFSEDPAPNP